MLEVLKEKLVRLHLELPKIDLTRWTGGHLFEHDLETGVVGRTTVEVLL